MTDALFRLELEVDDYLESLQEAKEENSAFDVNVKEILSRGRQYWGAFFDFLKTGTGESAQRVKLLEERVDRLKASISTAAGDSGGIKSLLDGLESLASAAEGGGAKVQAFGDIVGGLAAPAFQATSALRDLYQLIATGAHPAETRARVAADDREFQEQLRRDIAQGTLSEGRFSRGGQTVEGAGGRGFYNTFDVDGGGGGGGGRRDSLQDVLRRAEQMGRQGQSEEEQLAELTDAQQRAHADQEREMGRHVEAMLNFRKDLGERQLAFAQEHNDGIKSLTFDAIAAEKQAAAAREALSRQNLQNMQREAAQWKGAAGAMGHAFLDVAGARAGSEAEQSFVKAGSEALDAVLSIPVWPEVARHTANMIFALATGTAQDARAGRHKSRGPLGLGGGGGGGSGGRGGPTGAASAGFGGFGAGGGGGAAGPTHLTINLMSPHLSGKRELADQVVELLKLRADAGDPAPHYIIQERGR